MISSFQLASAHWVSGVCIREGYGVYAVQTRVPHGHEQPRWEAGWWEALARFAPLTIGHIINMMEEVSLEHGTVFGAGACAVVTAFDCSRLCVRIF